MGTHYAHLTETDRMSIQALLQAKLSGPEIARQLDFSHSTINRELDGTREIYSLHHNGSPRGLASVYVRNKSWTC